MPTEKWATVLIILIILAAVVYFGVIAPGPSPGPVETARSGEKSAAGETTIRNVVNTAVAYRIRALAASGEGQERLLQPGEIDRLTGDPDLEITFERDSKTITYKLSAGQAYCFRYDENAELELFEGSHGRDDAVDLAPYVPTPMPVVKEMLELAEVNAQSVVYDLGCGDGRIIITAAVEYGARGVGVDIDPQRILEAEAGARAAGVEGSVRFLNQDVMKTDFSEATVVALYLLPESNTLLRPGLETQLRPGTIVVSHNYRIDGWSEREIRSTTVKDSEGEDHFIYVYRR